MPAFKHANFNDRASAAAKAKQALIEKFRARPGPDDPAVIAQREAREAIAAAREIREQEPRLPDWPLKKPPVRPKWSDAPRKRPRKKFSARPRCWRRKRNAKPRATPATQPARRAARFYPALA